MLRITVKKTRTALTFKLEGRLAAPSLAELEACWNRTILAVPKPIIRVDLSGVTFIDNAGKECLVAIQRQGAELIAIDCLNKDIVREILEARSPTVE